MNVNPRQYDPEFQDPNAADTERKSQFGMQSQADMPLSSDATGMGATGMGATGMGAANAAPAWGQRDVLASAPVYGSDDKKIGTVQESYNDSFKVKSGLLITHDYYFPYSAIAHSDPERIVLNLTSDEAKSENWRERPQTDATGMGGMGGTTGMTGMGAATGGALGGTAADTAAAPQPTATTGEYGIYGPEGPEDTIQAATERGAHPEDTAAVPPPTSAPVTPNAGRLPSGADTATPAGSATPMTPTQGDMLYRGTMGPNNEPGAPDRAYNPGLQGTDTSTDAADQRNAGGRLAPEQDPTSWNADQQPPNPGV